VDSTKSARLLPSPNESLGVILVVSRCRRIGPPSGIHLGALCGLTAGGWLRSCHEVRQRAVRSQRACFHNQIQLKVPCAPCRYELSAMGKFALLIYMSEVRLRAKSFVVLIIGNSNKSNHFGAQGTFKSTVWQLQRLPCLVTLHSTRGGLALQLFMVRRSDS